MLLPTPLPPSLPGACSAVIVAYAQSALWLQKRKRTFWLQEDRGGIREGFTKEVTWLCHVSTKIVSLRLNTSLLLREWVGKVTVQEEEMERDGCSRKTESSNVLEGEGHGRWHWKMPKLSELLLMKNCSSVLACPCEKLLNTSSRVFPPTPSAPLVRMYYYVLVLHLHFCNVTLFI